MLSNQGWSRCTALGVIEHPAGALLLDKGYDLHKNQSFYRLLGGGVECDEHSSKALARELQQQTGAAFAIGNLPAEMARHGMALFTDRSIKHVAQHLVSGLPALCGPSPAKTEADAARAAALDVALMRD